VSSERCDMGLPEFGLECLRPKGHFSHTCPCFSIYRDPTATFFGMGVYIDHNSSGMFDCETWLVDDEFPDDIILEVIDVKD
jgi:hypothetical protein